MKIGMIVPVMSNFFGFANLMQSVDLPIIPIIINNWDHNNGVPKAWNAGLARARGLECDYAFVSNDDVIVLPGTMKAIINHLDEFDLLSAYTGSNKDSFVIESINNDSPDFAFFAVKPREFIDKFGFFDENFKPAYFEDNDMRYRIKIGGGRQGIVSDATMIHAGSVTQNKGGNDDNDRVVSHHQFRLNRDYYSAKWGGWPGNEKYSTPFNRGGSIKEF